MTSTVLKKFLGVLSAAIAVASVEACTDDDASGMDNAELPNTTASSIVNGTATSTPGVPRIESLSGTNVAGCSSFETRDRCIVTAAHCMGGTRIVVKQHTKDLIPGIRGKVLPKNGHPAFDNTVTWSGDDIAVIWTGSKVLTRNATTNSYWLDAKAPNAKFTPLEMATMPPYDQSNIKNGLGLGWGPSTVKGADFDLRQASLQTFGSKFVSTGSYFVASPRMNPHQWGTQGDSGGPFLNQDGKVAGVFSTAQTPTATTSALNTFAGFSLESDPTKVRSDLTALIRDVCRPQVEILINNASQFGTVTLKEANRPDLTVFNTSARQRGVNTMTLEAVPATKNYTFKSWANGADGVCPCDPTQAKCEISATYLSYVAATFEKMENVSCMPVWGTSGTGK